MKRKILSCIFASVTSIMLLCGCHGGSSISSFEIPEEFDTSNQYEITFWAKNDTNVAQTTIYKKAIEDFQKLYPNITVNMRLYTDYGRIYNDVITNISTNTTPNVCITYPDHIATYMTGSNVMFPLDEIMVDPKYGLGGSEVLFDSPKMDEIIPKYLEECKLLDHYYALPYMRSTEALYINKTLLNKLGYEIPEEITWDFIWEASEKAMEKNSDGTFKLNGQNVLIPFIYKSTDNMMISMLKQLDIPFSDENGNIYAFNDDTGKILLDIAPHAESGAFSTFQISSYPGNYLNANQCIFAIDSTAGATWMGSDAPLSDICSDDVEKFETEIRPIPQFDAASPKMISQGPSLCIFNKADTQEVLASWLFAQYLLTNDIQIGYSKTEGYVPVTSKAQNDSVYLDYLSRRGENNNEFYSVKIDAASMLLNNIDNTFVTAVFNGSASLRSAAGQMIENTVKAKRRKQTVDEAFVEKTFKDVQDLYHLNEISGVGAAKHDLGALPSQSVLLLSILGIAWVLIILYVLYEKKKNKHTH